MTTNISDSIPRSAMFEPPKHEEPTIYGLDKRLSTLEQWVRVQGKSLDRINTHLTTIVWLIVGGLVTAIFTLITRGV